MTSANPQDSAVSVPLQRSNVNGAIAVPRKPVWPISDASSATLQIPHSARCSAAVDGKCCRDLIQKESWIDPDIVRDVIIGCSDGLTVPFALTAGLSSLGDSRLVVVGGLAELCAGAISMGVGGYLGSQAERDYYHDQRMRTSHRVLQSCEGEMEREVITILGPVGVDDKLCAQLSRQLRGLETDLDPETDPQTPDVERNGKLRWGEQVGLSAFLLKFGRGMEEIPSKRMYISAFTIGLGYLVGGLIPLIPYFFIPKASVALLYSSVFTGVVLFLFGAIKARITGVGTSIGGLLWGALTTLLVGGIAAGAAFGIVRALEV